MDAAMLVSHLAPGGDNPYFASNLAGRRPREPLPHSARLMRLGRGSTGW